MSMNIAEYIESGVLYNYCLGILSAEENAEVERLAAQYQEIRKELAGLQETSTIANRLLWRQGQNCSKTYGAL